jgi:uncharacterized protein YecE (DUF72 family)
MRAERQLVAGRIRIGTSGWEYAHWAGDFYPTDLPRDRWLERYANEFDTVELNNSFYRLPEARVFAGWARRVPREFRFAVKASRYLTHIRRLREPEEPLRRFWTRARRLGWRPNEDRLRAFLEAVPDWPQAIEFRDPRWYRPATLHLLAGRGVALCLHDMGGSKPPIADVGPFVYLRFHGAGARYGGRYSSQRLSAWADRIVGWADGGLAVWAYFNNDAGGHAVRDAARLRTMVERRRPL